MPCKCGNLKLKSSFCVPVCLIHQLRHNRQASCTWVISLNQVSQNRCRQAMQTMTFILQSVLKKKKKPVTYKVLIKKLDPQFHNESQTHRESNTERLGMEMDFFGNQLLSSELIWKTVHCKCRLSGHFCVSLTKKTCHFRRVTTKWARENVRKSPYNKNGVTNMDDSVNCMTFNWEYSLRQK